MGKNLQTVAMIAVGVVLGLMAYRAIEKYEIRYQSQALFEANAIGNIRTLNTALLEYSVHHGGYPKDQSDLGPDGTDLVSSALASGVIPGYGIRYTTTDGKTYQIQA